MENIIISPKIAAQTGLNRRSEVRADAAYISNAITRAKILALFDLRTPIVLSPERSSAEIRWFSASELLAIATPNEFVFLGEDEDAQAVFACNLQPFQTVHAQALLEELKPLVDLRSLALQGVLSDDELLIASQARSILSWHGLNRCCTRCGGQIKAADGGWRRHCGACSLDAYPRTDPAVIMLITRNGQCLLGHEHRFPEKLYSTLAGYVEAGDDIEHAVRREIKEEVGVAVGAVHYVASQPWPFPHSLMIGCWGEALDDVITLDKAEIADARWFGRDDVASMLDAKHPQGLIVPPRISMAYTLIRGFVDGTIGR